MFRAGDFIKGTERGNYSFTNSRMTKAIVVEVMEFDIIIKVLEHEDRGEINTTYTVSPEHFDIYEHSKQTFTKQDLKTGMKVKTENGQWWRVLLNTNEGDILIYKTKSKGWNNLYNYNDDLTHKTFSTLFNITKVYKPKSPLDNYTKHYGMELIWKRGE